MFYAYRATKLNMAFLIKFFLNFVVWKKFYFRDIIEQKHKTAASVYPFKVKNKDFIAYTSGALIL